MPITTMKSAFAGMLTVCCILAGAPGAVAQASDTDSARCDAGSSQACKNLGDEYYYDFFNKHGGPDKVKARALYERACSLVGDGIDNACPVLYAMLATGEGGPKDAKRAAAMKPKACGTGIISIKVWLMTKGVCEK